MGIEIDLERDSLLEEVSRKRLRESYMKEEEQSPQERLAFLLDPYPFFRQKQERTPYQLL